MKIGAIQGMKIAFESVVPTLFPFFILSDIWGCYFITDKQSFVAKLFEKLFFIPSPGISAFIAGNVCGFPLGVKIANKLYLDNNLSKEQATILCGISNNPSAAFVISGVGLGLFGSYKTGLLLYLSCIIASIFSGIIFRKKGYNYNKTNDNIRQKFDLTSSIKNAGLNSIIVSSYIIFFSAVLSLIGSFVRDRLLLGVISAFLEVSGATTLLSQIQSLQGNVILALIAFSLGFSGLSVHFQAFSMMNDDLSKTKYLLVKLTQGLLSSLMALVLLK
jgi:hypothetical protein